jgi:hypothetical protein
MRALGYTFEEGEVSIPRLSVRKNLLFDAPKNQLLGSECPP